MKRLILTDGSYQTATEWKKNGDRVKYFSAERGEWEEIPVALVDWKATAEWNAARAKSQDRGNEAGDAKKRSRHARRQQLNTPLVAPELRLPAEGGVFLLEELAGKTGAEQGCSPARSRRTTTTGKNILLQDGQPDCQPAADARAERPGGQGAATFGGAGDFCGCGKRAGSDTGRSFRIVRMEQKKRAAGAGKQKGLKDCGDQSQKESVSAGAGGEVQRRLVEGDSPARI